MGLFKQVLNQYRKFTFMAATKNIIYHWKTREKQCFFGEKNADKQFYVVRSLDDTSKYYIGARHNLMANYFYVLSHLAHAQENKLLPVVDQLKYPVYISQKEPVNGSCNPWEYFWKQPYGNVLEEVYQSKHVTLSKQSWFGEWDMGYDITNYTDPEIVKQYHALSELVPLNQQTRCYCDEIRKKLFSEQDRILGVSVRIGGHSETAFAQGAGHPRQASAEEMIEIVKDRLQRWDMQKVFLATDSDYAISKFREAFGEALIVMPRMRISIGSEKIRDAAKPMFAAENIIQTTMDYIAEMELLAACTGLLGSVSSGLRYAVVRNGSKYEQIEILDFGRFEDKQKKNPKMKK